MTNMTNMIRINRWMYHALDSIAHTDIEWVSLAYIEGLCEGRWTSPFLNIDHIDKSFADNIVLPLWRLTSLELDLTMDINPPFRADPDTFPPVSLSKALIRDRNHSYSAITQSYWSELTADDLDYLDGIIVTEFEFGLLFNSPERYTMGQLRFSR